MTDKELRKLSRAELVNLIHELEEHEEELNQSIAVLNRHLDEANSRLQSREKIYKESGSIAEASLALHGVFQAAQTAADEYLNRIHSLPKNVDEVCEKKLIETKAECDRLRAQADEEIQKKWDEFNGTIRHMVDTQAKLRDMMKVTSDNSDE